MNQFQFARYLRKNQTEAENKLWYYIRRKQLGGKKFRRQYMIGNYIVDFVCIEKKLIVELDGGQHNEEKNQLYDKERSIFLESLGYKILRFWDNEVFENLDGVMEVIVKNLEPPPTPSLKEGEVYLR